MSRTLYLSSFLSAKLSYSTALLPFIAVSFQVVELHHHRSNSCAKFLVWHFLSKPLWLLTLYLRYATKLRLLGPCARRKPAPCYPALFEHSIILGGGLVLTYLANYSAIHALNIGHFSGWHELLSGPGSSGPVGRFQPVCTLMPDMV